MPPGSEGKLDDLDPAGHVAAPSIEGIAQERVIPSRLANGHMARIDARHVGEKARSLMSSMNSSLVPLLTSRCGFKWKR